MSTHYTWTDALTIITELAHGDEARARRALGTLLDEPLELPQPDDVERVITPAELTRAATRLDQS